jgi:hypothetical protein
MTLIDAYRLSLTCPATQTNPESKKQPQNDPKKKPCSYRKKMAKQKPSKNSFSNHNQDKFVKTLRG